MQIPESELQTVRGKVIGIGEVKVVRTMEFDYEIPSLSFVVIHKKDGNYVSSCIQLQMDGYGETAYHAQRDMADNITYYLYKNFSDEYYKEHCWENILDLFESNEDTNILWDKYHTFQIMLAEQGKNPENFPVYYSNTAAFKQRNIMIDIPVIIKSTI